MKLVINTCYGGFSISKEAAALMAGMGDEQAAAELAEYEKGGKREWCGHGYVAGYEIDGYARDNPNLIRAVEYLGEQANGARAKLKVVEIPDDEEWEIEEYDGRESVVRKKVYLA